MHDCAYEISCKKCRHKCKEYIEYMHSIELKNMLQGEDRQPLKREHGALRRK